VESVAQGRDKTQHDAQAAAQGIGDPNVHGAPPRFDSKAPCFDLKPRLSTSSFAPSISRDSATSTLQADFWAAPCASEGRITKGLALSWAWLLGQGGAKDNVYTG